MTLSSFKDISLHHLSFLGFFFPHFTLHCCFLFCLISGPLAPKKLVFKALKKWVHLFSGLLHVVRVFHFPSPISSLYLHWRDLLQMYTLYTFVQDLLFASGHSPPVRGSPRDCSASWEPLLFS